MGRTFSLLMLAAIVLAVMVAAWKAGRPPRFFVVRLKGGHPRKVSGNATVAFLAVVREVAVDHGMTTGTVAGVERRGGIGLEFSRHFPETARQRLRNWWVASGWRKAPKRAKGR